jgi:DNA-directed RNA polymerase subunit M/transcription elongation factor TFIIS
MSDLMFSCPECANALVVDRAGAGSVLDCPDCGASIQVPQPVKEFACSRCSAPLCAPRELLGKTSNCPACSAEIVVPWGGYRSILCPVCNRDLHVDRDRIKGRAGAVVRCIACHVDVHIDPATQRTRLARPSDHPMQEPISAPPAAAPAVARRIPRAAEPVRRKCVYCGQPLDVDTVVCVGCGTDQKTGKLPAAGRV